MDNCIFCKIADKKIRSKTVYEDDEVIAFHDINPAAPVHILIVPKKHVPTLVECGSEDQALLGKMAMLAPKLANELAVGYADGKGGFKTVYNVGPDGGQEVYHLHMHVLGGPRPWARSLV